MDTSSFRKKNLGKQDFSIFNCDTETLDIDIFPSSGSRQRGFTSVRVASLRSSGLAAARCMMPERTFSKPNPSSIQQDLGVDCIRKCNGTSCLEDVTSLMGTNICKQVLEHENESSYTDMLDKCMDGTDRRIKNSRVRRLWNDGADGNGERINKVDNTTIGKTDGPLSYDHAAVGLSYVEQQETSEQLQERALEIVDKILFINDGELFAEEGSRQTLFGESPLATSARGTQNLAKRANLRSQLEKPGIFDWVDSREDDGGGDFFTKRKDVLLGSEDICKSHTQFQMPKHLSIGDQDQVGKKGKDVKSLTHQKIIGLSTSDSGLPLQDLTKSDEVQVSGAKLKKNLFKAITEQSNDEPSGQELEPTSVGSQGLYNIGVGTQLAAEALEALVCGIPADHDFRDAHPETRKMNEDNTVVLSESSYEMKYVLIPKRARSSTASRNSCLKHSKNLSMTVLRGESPVKTRAVREKLKQEEHLSNGDYVKGNKCLGRESPKIRKREGEVGASGREHIKEVDKRRLPSNRHLSNKNGLLHRENLHGTVAPVAHFTRRSKTKIINVFANASNTLTEDKNSKLCPDSIYNLKCNTSQLEMWGIEEMLASSYPKRRRTRQSISVKLSKTANLAIDAFPEANAESIIGHRRSKTDVGSFGSPDTMKRKTRSAAVHTEPLVTRHMLPKAGNATSGVSTNETNNEHGLVNDGADSSILIVEDAKHTIFDGASEEVQPSDSTCTPTLKGIDTVSPIYTCDEPKKQSEKEGLSRSHLIRELARLDATEAAKTPAFKNKRQRRDITSICVLFSHHLGEDIIKQQKKILARLGASVTSSSSEATHFIADKFVRTRNMLEAMALGKPVVTHFWLESCGQASCFIDEIKYILRDLKKEKEIGFSMPVSLTHASHSPLLQGKRVLITRNVKPDKELIASLVKAIHGRAIERMGISTMKNFKATDDLLIISCEEDYEICVPLLERGVVAYSSELLLNGIVIQKLEYNRHRLFMDHAKRTRSAQQYG